MARSRRVCLDTSAVIYLFNRVAPYAQIVEELMDSVRDGRRSMVLSTVTELELLVRGLRHHDFQEQGKVNALFGGVDHVSVHDLTRPIVRIAAQMRALRGLSLADSAIAATALYADCDAIIGNDSRCAERVQEIPYYLLDDLVKEQTS